MWELQTSHEGSPSFGRSIQIYTRIHIEAPTTEGSMCWYSFFKLPHEVGFKGGSAWQQLYEVEILVEA